MRKITTLPNLCKARKILLSQIVADAGIQCRAQLDQDTIKDYSADLKSGSKFPLLIVFYDGEIYRLADGFHRFEVAKLAELKSIQCDVRKGSRLDALKFFLGANANHGLRRTNADKRRAVEIALAEWPNVADAELARWCAVSHPLVASVRRDVQGVTVTPCRRIGGDGKAYSVPPVKPKPAFNLHERFNQLSADNQLIVGAALCRFDKLGRSVSPDDVAGLIDHLQRQARN